jgi:cytochrome c5
LKLLLTTTIVSLLTFGSALAADDANAGKAVFDAKCKMCHGNNGEGNPVIAKMMKVTMHPFSSKEVQSKSDEELKKDIVNGNGKMRPVKGLSDKQLDDVVAFIRSLAKKK